VAVQPSNRRPPNLHDQKVLLIDCCQATRAVRATVLRSCRVEVHETENLSGARLLWQPNVYDLVMLDVRRQLPGDSLEFYEQIRDASPHQRFAFLVGPPLYLSRTWPGDVEAGDEGPRQWAETEAVPGCRLTLSPGNLCLGMF